MIHELTRIHIQPGKQKEFEAAVAKGVDEVIRHSTGFIAYKLNQSLQNPELYQLHISWETYDNHMIDFRESPAFPKWRAYVSEYFVDAPSTEHYVTVLGS